MKIRIVSDLHLEFSKKIIKSLISSQEDNYCDCLIMAGDIVTYKNINDLVDILDIFSPRYQKIFYVLGNHEYYHKNDINIVNLYREICNKYPNVILLENDSYKLNDNWTILGTTLWSNISEKGLRMMSDGRYISMEDILEKHTKAVKFLEDQINLREVATEDGSLSSENFIVVTHHLPSKSLVHRKYSHYDNSGFASSCDHLFRDNIKYFVYGHTHTKSITKIGQTNLICNSLGYPGEQDIDLNEYCNCIIEI
jgi:predicted phosphodiesterase